MNLADLAKLNTPRNTI